MTRISELLSTRQAVLRAKLESGNALSHPTAKGDVSEFNWAAMLDEFLPGRYQVSIGSFIIDSKGNETSEQDLVIHDNYFHPQIFESGDRKVIPAESVYAVFEAKQEMTKGYIEQAQRKAKEVRQLERTSGEIQHAGGVFDKPRLPLRIISGILTDKSGWTDADPFGAAFRKALSAGQGDSELDMGYAVAHGAFLAQYESGTVSVAVEPAERGLLFFLTRLYDKLLELGSVPKLDIIAYDREAADEEPPQAAKAESD